MKESIKQWCENNNDYTMLQEWDYSTNEESPESVYRYSAKDINWICKECGKKFIRKPHNIKVLYNCPTCRKKKSSKKRYETLLEQSNSLAADFPQLMEEWDYEHNEVNPNLLLPKSNIRVQWICKNCRNTYVTSISHRVNEGTGCPYCSGKKVKYGFNDLESSYPELLKEWDYEKNKVEPKNVFKNSR